MSGTWIDSILRHVATLSEVSDLVLEPLDDGKLAVRARLAGVYLQLDRCPADGSAAAIARLKALAGVPAYIVDEPQDGRINGRAIRIARRSACLVPSTVRGPRAALHC